MPDGVQRRFTCGPVKYSTSGASQELGMEAGVGIDWASTLDGVQRRFACGLIEYSTSGAFKDLDMEAGVGIEPALTDLQLPRQTVNSDVTRTTTIPRFTYIYSFLLCFTHALRTMCAQGRRICSPSFRS